MAKKSAKAERFEIDAAPHGQGGFGRVLRGRDNELERDVAIKELDALASKFEPDQQERFRREARILARLSHPNIPAIYDVLIGDESFQIVFQFVAGKTLRQIIDEGGPVSLAKAQVWFRQVASALEHAHAIGVIHRDVKPQNIIITEDGESAYLVDFGIALSKEEATRLTDSGKFIGTPGYAPPEQLLGETVDASSDVFALAVTLYEALSASKLVQGDYRALSDLNQAIPPGIDELIEECLRQREQRVPSARAFAQRLAQASVPARPLAEVLARGRLHEIAVALEALSADSFAMLPAGQRALLFVKLEDVTDASEPSLQYAARDFLRLLAVRGLRLPRVEYQKIAVAATFWAFEHVFGSTLGDRTLREALGEASSLADTDHIGVLAAALVEQIGHIPLDDRQDWYLHALRELIQIVLANPSLPSEYAAPLAAQLQKVNKTQRSRAG